MKCFSTILGIFWKIDFLKEIRQPADLTKLVKFSTSLNCAKKYFLHKSFIPSSNEVFLHNFRHFWKIDFLKEIRQPRTLQN